MYPLELRHLIGSSERLRLVTLGVCRHLDGVEASCAGELLKEGCEKTRAVCEWLGARVPTTRVGSNPSGARCWLGLESVQDVGLTSEEGLIRGAGPIGLGFPQRGLWENGNSPTTTVKHNRVIFVV